MSYARANRAVAETEALHRTVQDRRENVAYVAEQYPDGTDYRANWPWGVVFKFKYGDRPELGFINGGFVWKERS